MIGTIRRRGMMAHGGGDPYADWVKIRTKNVASGNNVYAGNLSLVDRMMVDGVEVTPATQMVFGDANPHIVYILFKDTSSIPGNAFFLANYTVSALDLPDVVVSFGKSAIRGLGASQRVDVAIRSQVMPTFGAYNWTTWTLGQLYVPSNLIEDYKTLTGWGDTKIHALEDYPWKL